jgi:hypothetical protein
MFTLTLHDRNGIELKEGDIVKISNGKEFTFYSEVKWLEKEKDIAPFHTFSFHSFEKVDKVPEKASKSTNETYDIWFIYSEDAEIDKDAGIHEKYLASWRQCEQFIEKRSYQINKI